MPLQLNPSSKLISTTSMPSPLHAHPQTFASSVDVRSVVFAVNRMSPFRGLTIIEFGSTSQTGLIRLLLLLLSSSCSASPPPIPDTHSL